MVRKTGAGDQERAPEAVACILIGYNMMTSYMVNIGAITTAQRQEMGAEALRILTDASRKQSREMESEKPTRIFLDTIGEMLASRKVWIKDLVIVDEKAKNEPLPMDDMIGYRDNQYYYLLPNVAFAAVSAMCRKEGHEFPVSLKALYKHLVADKVVTGLKDGESPARPKNIGGKTCGSRPTCWTEARIRERRQNRCSLPRCRTRSCRRNGRKGGAGQCRQ